jgi:hypothetical protein
MTPSSVTQFVTITFPISCPFGFDSTIQMLAQNDKDRRVRQPTFDSSSCPRSLEKSSCHRRRLTATDEPTP